MPLQKTVEYNQLTGQNSYQDLAEFENNCEEFGQGVARHVLQSSKMQTRGSKKNISLQKISNSKREKISLQLKYRNKKSSRKSSGQSEYSLERIEPGSVQYTDLGNDSFILKREVA